MNAPLAIDLLSTRIRSEDVARAQALAGQVRQLADNQLATALDGAHARALHRAGLPADAAVAVARLDVTLKVGAGVDSATLATGWAAAFEARLAALLAATPAGDDDTADGQDAVVWFADTWQAERRHLQRRATGQPDAWWAEALAVGETDEEQPFGPEPHAILTRWLQRDPPRARALLAELAQSTPDVAGLLAAPAAQTLTRLLLAKLGVAHSLTSAAPHDGLPPAEATDAAPPDASATNPPPPITPAQRATLDAAIRALAPLHAALLRHATPTQAAPWLAAALLNQAPSLAGLPAAFLQHPLTAPPPAHAAEASPQAASHPAAADPNQSAAAHAPAALLDASTADAASGHAIHAGGLLLLLRPLMQLELLPTLAADGAVLADVALCALRRVLAPLPAGARMAAEERERPLLALLAPEQDWRELIAHIPLGDAAAVDTLVDRLVAAIPPAIEFAPGSERQVFGPGGGAYASAEARRLAQLVLRPGQLRVSPWQAEMVWPLACIDIALRRAGWDQDPGWLPWLGRRIVFRFGESP